MTQQHPDRDAPDPAVREHRRSLLAEQPTGWDLSDLDMTTLELPWSYETIVRNLVVTAHRVLDLGTGGGELLASLADVLPEGTVATEGWEPNVPVARDRLAPLGIEVIRHDVDASQARLPFPDASFDLVLCRHEAFDAQDVARVLAPRGAFLTQQVAADDLQEIHRALDHPTPFPEATLAQQQNALVRAGLTVERADVAHGHYRVADMDTLLRYLRRVPWNAPADLDADRHGPALDALAASFADGPLELTASRFVLLARRPAEPDEGRTDFSALPTDDLVVPEV